MSTFYKDKLEYFSGGYYDPGYWDYIFIDVDPRNQYEISYSEFDDDWYGTISATEEGGDEFLFVRELTVEELAECIDLIPGVDFPGKLLCHQLDECHREITELKARIAELKKNLLEENYIPSLNSYMEIFKDFIFVGYLLGITFEEVFEFYDQIYRDMVRG